MSQTAVFYRSVKEAAQLPADGFAQIAFAGRSNVGKSSLLNRLVNRKSLAKTSKTPGRTRLINFFLIDESFYFVDLPGYGYAKVSRAERNEWGRMVDEYFNKAEDLKGLVLLVDCRRELNDGDRMLLDWLRQRQLAHMIVLTKADKLSRNNLVKRVREMTGELGFEPLPFSIQTGVGKKELWKWIDNLIRG